jgi:hypothetical protein
MFGIRDIVQWFPILHPLHEVRVYDPRQPNESTINLTSSDELCCFFGGDASIEEDFGVLDQGAVRFEHVMYRGTLLPWNITNLSRLAWTEENKHCTIIFNIR